MSTCSPKAPAAHGEARIGNIRWVEAVAEAIPSLDLAPCRLVTFGQSYQWTDQVPVAEAVYDILEPGGALALVVNTVEGRPEPEGPGYPPIPHDEIHEIIRRYLGPRRRATGIPTRHIRTIRGRPQAHPVRRPSRVFAPGRPDVVRDVDGVLAGFLSMSFASPHLFGDRLGAFEADVRTLLTERSPSGLFWDWPGDTEVLLARKPG